MMGRCNAIRDELAFYQSGEGTAEERAQISTHLQTCAVCQREAKSQAQIREGLLALKMQTASVEPPARLWKNATQAWNQHDARKNIRVQFRLGVVGACLLLFIFGAAWARYMQPTQFPITAIKNNFSQIKAQPDRQKVAYASADADRAAQWLTMNLGAKIPVIKLQQGQLRLIGADILPNTNPVTGRLLYRTEHGLVALYVTPNGTDFGKLSSAVIENYRFRKEISSGGFELLGWSQSGIGYGLTFDGPKDSDEILAVEAQRATE